MKIKRLRFQKGIMPSGKEFEVDIYREIEDQKFMKGSYFTQEEKDSMRKHWEKTLLALETADEINFKSMN